MNLSEELEAKARDLGFARFGVAEIEPLGRDGDALQQWIARGHHASMGWMADTLRVRLDPSCDRMLPGARRIIVVATAYSTGDEPIGPAPGLVARYARGRDYHNVIGKRMRKLARVLRDAGHLVRMTVDTMPVLERAWAQRAGLGFIGKNCCLIIPGIGSHVFLSTLVTDAELPVDEPMHERCGTCRLCLDACPTDAFVEPRVLDSRRCISYLTIEHRGPIDESLRSKMGSHFFGCDDCQDVCPFNQAKTPDRGAAAPFAPHERFDVPAQDVLVMSEEDHRAWGHASPVRRAGREGLARNAAIVLGNVGDRRHLPVLERVASDDPSEAVKDAARWATARIERS